MIYTCEHNNVGNEDIQFKVNGAIPHPDTIDIHTREVHHYIHFIISAGRENAVTSQTIPVVHFILFRGLVKFRLSLEIS